MTLFPWGIVYHFATKPHSASKAASSSLIGWVASHGYPVFDPVVLSNCPHTVGLSRILLSAAPTKIRLLFRFAMLVANPLTRSVAPVTTTLDCYILIPGETCINSFPANVIQENAPSIDFDQSC